ncbi:MAG: SDR family NAD(P)-dependent oxidoreductase [Pseudomonadota bacterium]
MASEPTNWTVITGSTGAIGDAIARHLAPRGKSLILLNRSDTKSQVQRAAILAEHPDVAIEIVTADLMDTTQVATATDLINDLPGRVDVLYNNSGVLTGEKILSAQGYESHFAVNTLAPYQLIRNLREKMARPVEEAPGMIVNFSSSAIGGLKTLDVEGLANPEKVGGLLSTYAQTKLAVTALAAALAEDLRSDNILIRAIDPGATRSAMTTSGNSGMPWFLSWLAPIVFASPERQALKIIDGADPIAFGGRSGIYVANRREKKMPAAGYDTRKQRDLLDLLQRSLETS